MVETFNLQQNYMANKVCHLCHAEKAFTDMCMASAHDAAPCFRNKRTLAEYQAEQAHLGMPLNPLCTIPGWSIEHLFEDLLHDDLLGVRQRALGGALLSLAKSHHWGDCRDGSWQRRLNKQLDKAWGLFVGWQAFTGNRCQMSKFSTNTLGMKKKHGDPHLKTKGHAAAICTMWLAKEARIALERADTLENRLRSVMLDGFDGIWAISKASRFLDAEQIARLKAAKDRALFGFHACREYKREQGIVLYTITPKFQKLNHLLQRACRTGVSPSATWTFSEEDMMKWCSGLCSKCHGLGIMKTPVLRWLVYFFKMTLHRKTHAWKKVCLDDLATQTMHRQNTFMTTAASTPSPANHDQDLPTPIIANMFFGRSSHQAPLCSPSSQTCGSGDRHNKSVF